MDACGYKDNPRGFFQAVFASISQMSAEKTQKPIVINNIPIPLLFLYWLLERLHPSNRLMSIKTIEQLREKTGVCPNDPILVQQVMDAYPVRLSDHVIRQSAVSAAVAYIRENPAITDVILHVPEDGKSTLTFQVDRICQIVSQLGRVEHIACIRLRWQAFQTCLHRKLLNR